MWSTFRWKMWRHRDDTADCWRVLLWTRIPESRYPAKGGWLLKEAGDERQESLSYGKIGYRFERGNIAHSFLQCEQSHELRSWQDMTLSSVESADDLSITEDAEAVIDAIIPEWVGRRWCIHWVAKHRERFNSITVKEFHRWKSQCG